VWKAAIIFFSLLLPGLIPTFLLLVLFQALCKWISTKKPYHFNENCKLPHLKWTFTPNFRLLFKGKIFFTSQPDQSNEIFSVAAFFSTMELDITQPKSIFWIYHCWKNLETWEWKLNHSLTQILPLKKLPPFLQIISKWYLNVTIIFINCKKLELIENTSGHMRINLSFQIFYIQYIFVSIKGAEARAGANDSHIMFQNKGLLQVLLPYCVSPSLYAHILCDPSEYHGFRITVRGNRANILLMDFGLRRHENGLRGPCAPPRIFHRDIYRFVLIFKSAGLIDKPFQNLPP